MQPLRFVTWKNCSAKPPITPTTTTVMTMTVTTTTVSPATVSLWRGSTIWIAHRTRWFTAIGARSLKGTRT